MPCYLTTTHHYASIAAVRANLEPLGSNNM